MCLNVHETGLVQYLGNMRSVIGESTIMLWMRSLFSFVSGCITWPYTHKRNLKGTSTFKRSSKRIKSWLKCRNAFNRKKRALIKKSPQLAKEEILSNRGVKNDDLLGLWVRAVNSYHRLTVAERKRFSGHMGYILAQTCPTCDARGHHDGGVRNSYYICVPLIYDMKESVSEPMPVPPLFL